MRETISLLVHETHAHQIPPAGATVAAPNRFGRDTVIEVVDVRPLW
jgi:hypothetical protein